MMRVLLDIDSMYGENAGILLARFQRAASLQGWRAEDIEKVLVAAKSKDYEHLVKTLSRKCCEITRD